MKWLHSNAKEKDFAAFSSNNHAYACENIHQSADDPIACLSQAWGRRSKIKAKISRWLPEAAAHLNLAAYIAYVLLYNTSIDLLHSRTRCTLVLVHTMNPAFKYLFSPALLLAPNATTIHIHEYTILQ
jgi:hypothetical protein